MAVPLAYLEMHQDSDSTTQQFVLNYPSREVGIGRSSDNDIMLNSPEVSRHHARMVWDEQQYLITDLNSSLGTRVNDTKLTPNVPFSLLDGDTIYVGPFALNFHAHLPRPTASAPLTSDSPPDTIDLLSFDQPVLRVSTPQWTKDFWLEKPLLTLGRDPACDIRIDVAVVSAQHAEIRRRADLCEIVDLGATNGIVFNGHRITHRILEDGDVLHIGPLVTLTYQKSPPVDVVPIAYNSVIKSLRDAVIVMDVQHRIMDMNPGAQELLGCATAEAIGKPVTWLFNNQPDFLSRYQEISQLEAGSTSYALTMPTCIFEKAQKNRYFDMNFSSLQDDGGRLAGHVIVLHDITRQRQAQQELQQAKEAAENYLLALRKELEIGTQIQLQFLPQDLPERDGWEFATCFRPARDVAGDFYDVFALPGDCIGLVIGDVSDKGVGSSLFMALFRSLIRVYSEQSYLIALRSMVIEEEQAITSDTDFEEKLTALSYTAPLKAVSLTNDYIVHNHRDANMFATIFFGVLDPSTGILTYANGGHESPVILDATATIKSRLASTGAAVGCLPNEKFRIEQVKLEQGDTFMAYTDGVTDARSPAGKFFREKQVLSLLQENPSPSAKALLDLIETRVLEHIDIAKQFDDITMLAVRYQGSA
jgi:sigma-B regulation protein RsbU (phosphoserine phosphatase)